MTNHSNLTPEQRLDAMVKDEIGKHRVVDPLSAAYGGLRAIALDLLREKEQRETGWQPIETAPKDGDVFLHFPQWGPIRGHWDDERYSKVPRPYWTHDREWLWGRRATRANPPTHWMPLPDHPVQVKQPQDAATKEK